MKKLIVTGLLVSITSFLLAQKTDAIINAKEVKRIEMVLACQLTARDWRTAGPPVWQATIGRRRLRTYEILAAIAHFAEPRTRHARTPDWALNRGKPSLAGRVAFLRRGRYATAV